MPMPGGRAAAAAALLLPLSGSSASLGAALFNAAQLALFEVGDSTFTLLPFDTKGTAEGAGAAAQLAVNQHVDIIIGPLFSGEAKAAAPVARQAGISILSFTADRTAAGNGVYILGFLPGPQALRAADYAASQGRSRLAVLAPSTEYGRLVLEALTNNAASLGFTVTSLQYYDPNSLDPSGPIKRLVKTDPKKPGDIGFDALLLPDEGARLRALAAALPGQGIDPAQIKLLGTMLWEDSRAGSEPALAGAWYAAPAQAFHSDFDNRYAKAFGGKPPRLASLGYDATALAAVLARRNPRDFSAAGLTNATGFAGVDGIFRLRADGTSERGYAIREVVPGGGPDKEIAPAPASFQAAY
jgi:ABC-type branched-subunit amino acid transport system substrate-binding protein